MPILKEVRKEIIPDTYSASFSANHQMQSDASLHRPRLLADIGGTNARFALEHAPGRIDSIKVLACAEYDDLPAAISAYLAHTEVSGVQHAAIAIANPVQGDQVKMTNHNWAFSIDAVRHTLGLETLLVVNDFTALAMSLPYLDLADLEPVGRGKAIDNAMIGLVGAGTGLGVGGLMRAAGRWVALDSEGGHVSFSPSDEREVAVLRHCWKNHLHVSAERLVSGPGISVIYQALATINGKRTAEPLATPDIIARGVDGTDPLCRDTLDCFCGMLGTVAANVAVTLGTRGGIYIGGGVVPRLGKYFASSPYRERFESKGRLRNYMEQIPTFIIMAAYPAFAGVSAILSDHLAEGRSQAR